MRQTANFRRRQRFDVRPVGMIQGSLTDSLRHRRKQRLAEKVTARDIAFGVQAAKAKIEMDRRLESVYFRLAQPLVKHIFQEDIIDISTASMKSTRSKLDGYLKANYVNEYQLYTSLLQRLSAIRRGWVAALSDGHPGDADWAGSVLDEMEIEMCEEINLFLCDLGITSPQTSPWNSP